MEAEPWHCCYHPWWASSSEYQDQSHLLTLHHWHKQDLWGGDCHCGGLGENTDREDLNWSASQGGLTDYIKHRVQINLSMAQKVFKLTYKKFYCILFSVFTCAPTSQWPSQATARVIQVDPFSFLTRTTGGKKKFLGGL